MVTDTDLGRLLDQWCENIKKIAETDERLCAMQSPVLETTEGIAKLLRNLRLASGVSEFVAPPPQPSIVP